MDENLREEANEKCSEDAEVKHQKRKKNIGRGENANHAAEEISSLKEENASLKQQMGEYEIMTKRAMADYDNYKKRTQKEKEDISHYANEKLIMDLLPITDNMERAIDSFRDDPAFKDYHEGIMMVLNQIYQLLGKYDVKEIEALGKEFDPYLHHAVAQEENSDQKSNTIVEVLLKGYTMNDKVIRPSMVKVAK